MNGLLYKLYMGDYDPTPDYKKNQPKVREELVEIYDQISERFSSDFVDHMCDLKDQLDMQTELEYYRAGFRFGARLMLEVFTPA